MKNKNIKLTQDQKFQMQQIFDAMEALRKDKDFMKKLKDVNSYEDFDDTNDDEIELLQFCENILDTAKPKVDVQVKKKWWHFWNTNPLVRNGDDVVVSKTGYIHESGGCLVMLMNTEFGQRIVALLGSRNTHTRFPEAVELVKN